MTLGTARSLEGFADTDWNFGSVKPDALHNIHPYPAKFIPEIPRTLIQHLRPPLNQAVMDPFCGSGTTLVEAQRLGYKSVGIDLNPVACLISEIKTVPLPPTFLEASYDCVHRAVALKAVAVPDIPNLSHWFSDSVSLGIAKLLQIINPIEQENVRQHLRLALSGVLVRLSNQDSDTRYAAVPNRNVEDNVFAQFRTMCQKLATVKSRISASGPPALVLNEDIFDVKRSNINMPVGMVVTSPPYPNAYEYWLYHKYRMWWLGWDPIRVRDAEIGARPHYFKKNPATVEDFKDQMVRVCTLVREVLVDGGYYCVVIGRSKIHGIEIDNSELIHVAAKNSGFELVTSIERTIAASRKSFNLSHARIKREHILVLRKA